MKGTRLLLGLALIAAVLLAGCMAAPGRGTPTVAARTTVPVSAAGAPTVLIVDPPFDGGVSSGAVTVSVQVTDFALVPQGGPNQSGTGHLVYYRDVTPRTVQGETALTAPGTYASTPEAAYTWEGIAPGTHTFAVQLVNGDNTPLDPPAMDAVDVTAVSSEMVWAG